MSLKIADRLFTGPLPIAKTVIRANQHPAVFAVISKEGEPWNPIFRMLEVGETGTEGLAFAAHPALPRWQELAAGELGLYLLQRPRSELDDAGRRALVETIRKSYNPPHGTVPIHGG